LGDFPLELLFRIHGVGHRIIIGRNPDFLNMGPLAGIRVVELAQIMAGPTCGMLLADMGADVIKVEKLPGGDDTRSYSQPSIDGESAAFMVLNRNKRGMAVNLKTAGGLEVVKKLLATADVVTENYRKGTLERLGLGYDVLQELNPRLVYCAISGYGRTGPYADKPGFDLILQGFAGIMSVTGEPGRQPAKSGTSIADINAGILAALGIVSALHARERTGRGQVVETSLMEAAVQQMYWQAAIHFATGVDSGPTGSAHILTAPYQAFPTSDGWINIGGANQSNWERIAKAIGRAELIDDPRFKANGDRMRNLEALVPLISERTRTRTSAQWIAEFEAAGVPVGPINKIGQVLADPQVKSREMVVDVEHSKLGRTRAIGLPIKFSETPGSVARAAPLLGEHTDEVLGELGYSADAIARLREEGAVA
jgi:crotonobetainyl-CoA:carnitine CoA-transferase CaiB-like acyl-CoA transferase